MPELRTAIAANDLDEVLVDLRYVRERPLEVAQALAAQMTARFPAIQAAVIARGRVQP